MTVGLKSVGIAALVYLAGVNLFLNSGLLPRIINAAANVRGEVFRIDYKSAWMLWPGRLRLRDFTLRAQARDIQWYLTIDRAAVRVDLLALVTKIFRATDVQAEGVTFRIRPRLASTAPKNAADYFPPIPGFEPFPILGDKDWMPSPEELERLFQVELKNVAVHEIRELWLADYHWTGRGEAGGNVFLRPPQMVELAPSSLRLESGTLAVGSEVIVPDLQGQLEAAIDRFSPMRDQGLKVLSAISAHVHFGGTLRTRRFVGQLIPSLKSDDVSGPAQFETDIQIVRGKLMAGTPLTIDIPDAKVSIRDYQLAGAVHVKGTITEDNEGGLARLEASVSSLSVGRGDKEPRLFRVPSVLVQANLDDLDLSHGFSPSWVGAEIKQADYIDLSFINAFLPATSEAKVLSGNGRVAGRFSWGFHSGLAEGELAWVSDGTRIQVGQTEIDGDFTLGGKLANVAMPGGKAQGGPKSQFDLLAKGLKVTSGTTQIGTTAHLTGTLSMDSEGKHGEVALGLGAVSIRSKGHTLSLAKIPELHINADLPAVESSPAVVELLAKIPDLRLLNAYFPEPSKVQFLEGRGSFDGRAEISKGSGHGKFTVDLNGLKAKAADFDGSVEVHAEAELAISDGKLELKPFQLRLSHGELEMGSEKIVRNLQGHATWDPEGFTDRVAAKGVLGALTAKVRLSGDIESVRFLNKYLTGPVDPTLDGGGGPFLLEAAVTRGKVAAGSQFSLEAKAVKSTWDEYNLQGSIRVRAVVAATPGVTRAAVSLLLSPLVLRRTGESKPLAMGQELRIDAPFKSADLTQDFLDTPAVIEFPPAKLTDLSFINLFLPKNTALQFTSGAGQVTGRLELGSGTTRGHGTIQLTTRDVEAYYSEIKVKGNIQAQFQISEMSLRRGEFELARSFVTLEGVRVEGADETADQWKGAVEVTRAELNVGQRRLEGEVHGRFKNARPIIAIFDATTELPPVVLPFLQLNGLTFDANMLMAKSVTDVTLHQMNGGPFDARGWLQVRDGLKTGALLINSGRLSVGLGVHDDVPVIQLKDAPLWFRRHGHPSILGVSPQTVSKTSSR